MRRLVLTLKGVLALAVLGMGWGMPGGEVSGSDGPKAPAVYYLTGNDAAAPESETVSVTQVDKAFEPSRVAVSVGGTVEFPNQDDRVHNVYSPKGDAAGFFDLGSAEQTKSDGSNLLTKEMTKEGIVEISCAVHPVMKGTIFVVPSKYHTVSTDGTYDFSNVPSGEYTVKVMKKDGTVSTLKTVQVD